MNKTTFKLTILVSTLLLFSSYINAQTQGTRPNILIILADDLGYADVGFNRDGGFDAGMGVIPTPQLDALANKGIICSNAHVVHPFCGPSRAGIMTGMYPHKIGAQYNLPNDITTTLGIPESETYFSSLIDQTGYNTVAFGKWHLGFVEGKYQPLDRGFDEFFGFCGGGKNYFNREYDNVWYKYKSHQAEYNDPSLYNTPKDNPNTNEYLDPIQRNREYVDRKEFGPDEYLTDILTDETIDFIDRKADDEDPFLIYLAYNAPHTPLQAPESEVSQFLTDNPNFETLIRESDYIKTSTPANKETEILKIAKEAVKDEGGEWSTLTGSEQDAQLALAKNALFDKLVNARITYATMVSNMDSNIGRIITKLETENIMDNTIIVFFSDNGGYTFSKGAVNYPLAALKGSVDEGGHRVPFFIHWPNKITSPSVYPYQVSSLDLYPSLVNLAGGTIPETKTIDGLDIIDKVIAGEDARPGEPLFVLRPQNGFHNAAIVSYPYRIVRKGANGSWKLYDVRINPEQQLTGAVGETTANAIIEDLQTKGANWVREFKEVKPAWFDHDRGDGHPHRILWFGEDLANNTQEPVFPGFENTYNDPTLAPGYTTDIDEAINNLFTVYPNPSSETFNIRFNTVVSELTIELISSSGKIMERIQSDYVNTSTIDVANVQAGMYVLRVKADNDLTIEKVIVL